MSKPNVTKRTANGFYCATCGGKERLEYAPDPDHANQLILLFQCRNPACGATHYGRLTYRLINARGRLFSRCSPYRFRPKIPAALLGKTMRRFWRDVNKLIQDVADDMEPPQQ